MSAATGAHDLAGRVVWRPAMSASGGALHNERPDLVPRVATGRPATQLPALMASLLSLCGPAHRLASQLAVDAAQGRPSVLTTEAQRQHQLDTLAEHVRRIWLDWPRWASLGGAVLAPPPALTECPALQAPPTPGLTTQRLDDTRQWLVEHVLGMAPQLWLAGWHAEGETWLHHWAASAPTWPAQWMQAVRPPAQVLLMNCHPWWPDEPALLALAEQLSRDPECARQPPWPVAAVETGPWCRLHDRARLCRLTGRTVSAWWRLGGRLADLARLCLPDDAREAHGRHALQHGSLHGPMPHSALAWIEMARGTLLHWVWLDGPAADARVRASQVVAPTEWNFHGDGPVARLLASLPAGPWMHRDAALAVAAWDPCVPFVIDPADTSTDRPTENAHA